MNGLPYYPRYPRDFFEGCSGMSFETKGAYGMLLDLIYMHGGALPDDAREIAGRMGLSVRRWNIIKADLVGREKITVANGVISNFRADKELIKSRKYQDKQAQNASAPRKNKDLQQPRHRHTDTDTDTEKKEKIPPTPQGGRIVCSRFSEFWAAYPHRNGHKLKRKPAEDKYRAAVRRGVSEQTIIDGAKRSHSDKIVRDGFARDPTTWLNQEGWADEVAAQVLPIGGSGLTVLADWVNSDRPLPGSAVTPAQAKRMVEAGLVSPEKARERRLI